MLLSDTDEGGPFDVLHKLRYKTGVCFDEHSEPYGTTVISRMLVCYYCNSFWVGLIFTLILLVNRNVALYLALPFAISGVVVLIQDRK